MELMTLTLKEANDDKSPNFKNKVTLGFELGGGAIEE